MTFEERLGKALAESCGAPHPCQKCKKGTVVNDACDECKEKVEPDQI